MEVLTQNMTTSDCGAVAKNVVVAVEVVASVEVKSVEVIVVAVIVAVVVVV